MKNKKYYLIIVAVIVVLGIGFLVNGQFLQGALRRTSVPPTPPLPTVDVKIDGSDGPVVISEGEEIEISWASRNATVCNFMGIDDFYGPVAVSGMLETKASELVGTESASDNWPRWILINCTGQGGMAFDSVQAFLGIGGDEN